MNTTLIIILAGAIVLLISLCHILYQKTEKLREIIGELQKKIKDVTAQKAALQKSLSDTTIDLSGRSAVYVVGSMYYGEDKTNMFTTTYEVDILESTDRKVKVKATDFTVDKAFAKDPKHRQGILDYVENKWVNRGDIQLIVDDATKRNAKLEKLLGKD